MKLEEVLPLLREGKKIRRRAWDECDYIQFTGNKFYWACLANGLFSADILSNDWEIVE